MEEAVEHARQHRDIQLEELLAFLAIPSISTQPAHRADVLAAASWLASKMRQSGLQNVEIIPTKGHPLVYADWLHAGPDAPTVLVYGHYDVQPAEPLELWESPPFEPEIRNGYILGRGASDDKGQLYVHVKAVEAFMKTAGRLPVNIKFIVEGEEESDGEGIKAFIEESGEQLKADVVLISDTAMLNPRQPAIVYGLRGNLYTFLDVTGPERDLHSGRYGGAINNPLNALGHIIAKLKDEDGRILIPGFYDDVRPLTDMDRAMMKELPFDEASWLEETGAPNLWGESEYSVSERIGARPTLDVNGIIGGYTGEGRKTVLPAAVHAKISMRLVPDQEPDKIAKQYAEYVESICPAGANVEVTICSKSPPSISTLDSAAMRAASMALEEVFGHGPVFLREGGSIPVVAEFQRVLGIETVMMGFGLPDDRIHSPNERFLLENYYRGVETGIRFLQEYANNT